MEYLKKNFLNRKIIIILFSVWTLLAFAFAGISYFAQQSAGYPVKGWAVVITELIRFYIWAAFIPFIYYLLNHFYTKKSRKINLFGVLVHIPGYLLFSFLHSIMFAVILFRVSNLYRERYDSVFIFFRDYVLFGGMILGLIFYALIVLAIQSFLFFRSYREEEARNIELQTELADAQLNALKMQLQPHFLFNTLHSIASLNVKDPQKANKMIAGLGEFLRMTLERNNEQMVTLEEELRFLRLYLEIEQIRFSDRLQVMFEVDSSLLSLQIPHLILQPLVENAIKHGIAPYAAKGEITISAERQEKSLLLKVSDCISENRINKVSLDAANIGKGLENVRQRLQKIYHSKADCRIVSPANDKEYTAVIEIPIAENSNNR